jgi:WD40 repeat protein
LSNGVVIWDINEDREIITFHSLDIRTLPAFQQDGKRIAGASKEWIKIWDVDTGDELAVIDLETRADDFVLLSFHPDGKRIAGASKEWIKIWDIDTGIELLNIGLRDLSESDEVFLSFHPDGKRMAIGGRGWIKIWDIEIDIECATIICESLVDPNIISMDDEGAMITGVFNGSRILVWDVDTGKIIYTLDAKMNCQGMQLSHAHGLEQEMSWKDGEAQRTGTLLEFFADRGAILDEEQQRTLAELRRRREEEERAKADAVEPPAKPKRSRRKKPPANQ